jgi:hypothetical protein
MSESRVLIEEPSPNGNQVALVEDDGRTIYLYIVSAAGSSSADQPTRSCWVRNLGPAPSEIDVASMKEGQAPMLPAKLTRFPMGGQPSLRPGELSAVWLEDGDSVVLLDRDEVIAAMLGDVDANVGFSRDCKEASSFCRPLDEARKKEVRSRLERADAFWGEWSALEKAWTSFKERTISALEPSLGKSTGFFSLGGPRWPPLGLARFSHQDASIGITTGMSIRPQPRQVVAERKRIELAAAVDASLPAEQVSEFFAWLAAIARLPWNSCRPLGPGSVLPCQPFPLPAKSPFTSVLLWPQPLDAPALKLPEQNGMPTMVLWAQPLSVNELVLGQTQSIDAMVKHLAESKVGWIYRAR